MAAYSFKTNINCQNCVKSVSPFLNGELDIESWSVDTDNPDKILTVVAEGIGAIEIQAAVSQAGFRSEPIKQTQSL